MTMYINPSTNEGDYNQRDQVLIFSCRACSCSINPSTLKCASHGSTDIIITSKLASPC